jgi:hypothetical protein
MLTTALLAHVLVFVYWLGGDLGAFYSSRFVVDPNRPLAARMVAAQILNNVDMAPRTALILALPTGLTVAVLKGWTGEVISPGLLGLAWVIGLSWLSLAWYLHLKHTPSNAVLAQIDFYWRIGLMGALFILAFWGEIYDQPLATFLRWKLALLAGAMACGLAIRIVLRPFGPAIGAVMRGESSAENEALIGALMARARIFVVLIWLFIIGAATLGLSAQV